MFIFHGLGGDADETCPAGFKGFADFAGVIIVCPNGTEIPGIGRGWNVGMAPPITGALDVPDDVEFVVAILDFLDERVTLDKARLYAQGNSNGGSFVHYLAREVGDFAAIASTAGSFLGGQTIGPHVPLVSVLQVHGDLDEDVPYNGGTGSFGVRFESATNTTEQ